VPRTGLVESWQTHPTELGPLYPFVGWEVAMTIACTVVFVAFLIWKIRSENRRYDS